MDGKVLYPDGILDICTYIFLLCIYSGISKKYTLHFTILLEYYAYAF